MTEENKTLDASGAFPNGLPGTSGTVVELEGSIEKSTQPERVSLLVGDAKGLHVTLPPCDPDNPKSVIERLVAGEPQVTPPYQGPKASNTSFYVVEGPIWCTCCAARKILLGHDKPCAEHDSITLNITAVKQQFSRFAFTASQGEGSLGFTQLLADTQVPEGWHPTKDLTNYTILMITRDQEKNYVVESWSQFANVTIGSSMDTDTMATEVTFNMAVGNYTPWRRFTLE